MKHYIFLLLWCLSIGYALDSNSALMGLLMCFLFFIISAAKIIKRSIIMFIIVFIGTTIFPPLAIVIAVLSIYFFLKRLDFVADNWRALLVGAYAYGVYLLVVIFNGFFYDTIVAKAAINLASFFHEGSDVAIATFGAEGVENARLATGYMKQFLQVCCYAFPAVLALGFHRLLKWLYRYNYSTDKALHVIALTPLITLAVILPFLKIEIGGHELFSGSLSDDVSDIDIDGDGVADNNVSLTSPHLPEALNTLVDAADVDIGGWLDENAVHYSPALEASFAALASRGVYLLEKEYGKDKIKLADGSVQIIQKDKPNHLLISSDNGKLGGEIFYDKAANVQHVNIGKCNLTVNNDTGEIKDNNKRIIGRINRTKIATTITDTNNNVIRTYNSNGEIINDESKQIGAIMV